MPRLVVVRLPREACSAGLSALVLFAEVLRDLMVVAPVLRPPDDASSLEAPTQIQTQIQTQNVGRTSS